MRCRTIRLRPKGLRSLAHAGRAFGVAGLFFCGAALGAPQLQAVSVSPNPLVLRRAARPEVIITVTVKRSPFDFSCDASIDPGDGRPGPQVSWSFGDSLTKTTRYEYRRPGRYRLRVSGSGNEPCRGRSQATVIVK